MSERRRRDAPFWVPLEPRASEESPYSVAAGLRSDDDEANETCRAMMHAAARDGDPRAIYAIATWKLHAAYGERRDVRAAMALLRRAAAGGIREAMYDLAVSSDLGRGARQDDARAYQWYLRAALRGDPQAVMQVANCLASGTGVEHDEGAAEAWYELAAALSEEGAEEARQFRHRQR